MTRPAKRSQVDKITRAVKGELWVLFIVIIGAIGIDKVGLSANGAELVMAKNLAAGALLNFVAQATFAWCVFKRSGYQARQSIVRQMYRGQMLKWAVTLIGFTVIFMTIRPLSAPAVFLGFIVMQVSHVGMLWRLR
ncbi:MAG: ATP synthase subunit I [Psychrobacter sp.]|nr:ATP synthase subunit I [Psychrobacter sp.]